MDDLADYADNKIKENDLKRRKARKLSGLVALGIFVLASYGLKYDTKIIWNGVLILGIASFWELLEILRDQKSLLQNIEIQQREIQVRLRKNIVDSDFSVSKDN
jgi:hypothetical protein